MKSWTIDELLAERPCAAYTRAHTAKQFGRRTRMTLLQILNCRSVPVADRLWVAWLPSALSLTQRKEVGERIVMRTVRKYALPCPETHVWAKAWLLGQDRTAPAAPRGAGAPARGRRSNAVN